VAGPLGPRFSDQVGLTLMFSHQSILSRLIPKELHLEEISPQIFVTLSIEVDIGLVIDVKSIFGSVFKSLDFHKMVNNAMQNSSLLEASSSAVLRNFRLLLTSSCHSPLHQTIGVGNLCNGSPHDIFMKCFLKHFNNIILMDLSFWDRQILF